MIAIIAILAAILFPVFAQARAKARQTVCLSNTRQIGSAIMMYGQDYDELLVPYRIEGIKGIHRFNPYWQELEALGHEDDPRAIWFNQLLFPYTKNDDVFRCPAQQDTWVNVNRDRVGYNATATDPSWGGQNSYGANNYALRPLNADPNKSASENMPIAMSDIPAPADTVGIVDGSYYNVLPRRPCNLPFLTAVGYNPASSSSRLSYWRMIGAINVTFGPNAIANNAQAIKEGKAHHQGMINVIWLDGHAKAMAYDKLVNDMINNPAPPGSNGPYSIWDPRKEGCGGPLGADSTP